MIEPTILKGFRDSLPKEEIPKKKIIRRLEEGFEAYGFVPIDTPVLEYSSVLLGKGGGETDKQVFSFQDNGKRDVAMRFDLTVPFARFLASHLSEIALPFKRYHINKVWRGEKPQKGRYREFIQCDFDIVGVDNSQSDYEILSMMDYSFSLLGITNYTFHISHRGLFNSFLEKLGVKEHSIEILRAVDKLRKIGKESVKTLLLELLSSEEKADRILSYILTGENSSFTETLNKLVSLIGEENESSTRLREIYRLLEETKISSHFVLDPSITRGLDYYTGIVYETFLDDLPSLGSVCSGGRYNDLASLYTKEKLPGVGSSIGLDRLLSGLEELKSPLLEESESADILITYSPDTLIRAEIVARELRRNSVKVDIYLEESKMKRIYDYAEKNQIPYLLTVMQSSLTLKTLSTREVEENISIDNIIRKVSK